MFCNPLSYWTRLLDASGRQRTTIILYEKYTSHMLYDVFVSHASEDKDSFVRPLAAALQEQNVEVWYDEYSLNVGDSLRRSIDRGLAQSRFGIVVLSPSFFAKKWTEWELDGLVARQNSGDQRLILPIWHGVTRDDVLGYSPPLADINAIPSTLDQAEIVRRLLRVIHPEGSALVAARDVLLTWGQPAPVVTDDWWLDVAGFAESNPVEDTFQSPMGWGRWGFPLPERSDLPSMRGERLAWAAMQMRWQEDAEATGITQQSHPDEVLAFLRAHPALLEICHEDFTGLRYLLAYAPQLAMPGNGGEFEVEIQDYFESTVELGSDGKPSSCAEDVVFRMPDLDGLRWSTVASNYVQGEIMGPSVRTYESFDYVPWLLSDASVWVEQRIRVGLLRGIAEWGVWPWVVLDTPMLAQDFGFESRPFTGAYEEALRRARSISTFRPGKEALLDLHDRIAQSARLLGLTELSTELVARFNESSFVDHYFTRRDERSSLRRAKS